MAEPKIEFFPVAELGSEGSSQRSVASCLLPATARNGEDRSLNKNPAPDLHPAVRACFSPDE
jgi:hypothetical protein